MIRQNNDLSFQKLYFLDDPSLNNKGQFIHLRYLAILAQKFKCVKKVLSRLIFFAKNRLLEIGFANMSLANTANNLAQIEFYVDNEK